MDSWWWWDVRARTEGGRVLLRHVKLVHRPARRVGPVHLVGGGAEVAARCARGHQVLVERDEGVVAVAGAVDVPEPSDGANTVGGEPRRRSHGEMGGAVRGGGGAEGGAHRGCGRRGTHPVVAFIAEAVEMIGESSSGSARRSRRPKMSVSSIFCLNVAWCRGDAFGGLRTLRYVEPVVVVKWLAPSGGPVKPGSCERFCERGGVAVWVGERTGWARRRCCAVRGARGTPCV